nr:hypothetical protein [uncultured Campylobacter sp.]
MFQQSVVCRRGSLLSARQKVCALSNLKLKFCEVLLWHSSARSVKFYRTKYRAGFWNFEILRYGGLCFEILRAVNLG